jgi:hypothetical protein
VRACKDCSDGGNPTIVVGADRWCIRCAIERSILTQEEAKDIMKKYKARQEAADFTPFYC